jgi:hypothetical protein
VSLDTRLNALSAALLDPKLLRGKGLGNEIGFSIFDYAPEREPDVVKTLPKVVQAVEAAGVRVGVIDLYQTVLGMLEERGNRTGHRTSLRAAPH